VNTRNFFVPLRTASMDIEASDMEEISKKRQLLAK
jgi:hypothetical protein